MLSQKKISLKGSFIERQTRGISSGNEWQRMTTSDNEWQRVKTNDYEWQQVTKRGTTSKNSTVYFKEWMIAILTKIDTLLQVMDGWY